MPEPDSKVFVELKKKANGIVYKRRLAMPNQAALLWLSGNGQCDQHSQIADEIDYFKKLYHPLRPTVFLSYEREAYYCKNNRDLRITFDENILCRQTDLTLESEIYGTEILPKDKILMEIKCNGGIPLWMTQVLSKEKIYKTSFSKYGTAYKTLIFPKTASANNLCWR